MWQWALSCDSPLRWNSWTIFSTKSGVPTKRKAARQCAEYQADRNVKKCHEMIVSSKATCLLFMLFKIETGILIHKPNYNTRISMSLKQNVANSRQLLFRIMESLVSDLDSDTRYRSRGPSWASSVSPGECQVSASNPATTASFHTFRFLFSKHSTTRIFKI
jgi:hypothetical protein